MSTLGFRDKRKHRMVLGSRKKRISAEKTNPKNL